MWALFPAMLLHNQPYMGTNSNCCAQLGIKLFSTRAQLHNFIIWSCLCSLGALMALHALNVFFLDSKFLSLANSPENRNLVQDEKNPKTITLAVAEHLANGFSLVILSINDFRKINAQTNNLQSANDEKGIGNHGVAFLVVSTQREQSCVWSIFFYFQHEQYLPLAATPVHVSCTSVLPMLQHQFIKDMCRNSLQHFAVLAVVFVFLFSFSYSSFVACQSPTKAHFEFAQAFERIEKNKVFPSFSLLTAETNMFQLTWAQLAPAVSDCKFPAAVLWQQNVCYGSTFPLAELQTSFDVLQRYDTPIFMARLSSLFLGLILCHLRLVYVCSVYLPPSHDMKNNRNLPSLLQLFSSLSSSEADNTSHQYLDDTRIPINVLQSRLGCFQITIFG